MLARAPRRALISKELISQKRHFDKIYYPRYLKGKKGMFECLTHARIIDLR